MAKISDLKKTTISKSTTATQQCGGDPDFLALAIQVIFEHPYVFVPLISLIIIGIIYLIYSFRQLNKAIDEEIKKKEK
ncbi:hypothetical protein CYY_002022 [Polysphondylium violaceum]|uniref:Uncharacterized protein n=1 Tax=Polysphondylium violaceum TaxID=133409 RepID=A0A8J4V7A5_9MYCE|nr:hypothetical protein CYY_002022 [Polysphondylium violaceum]